MQPSAARLLCFSTFRRGFQGQSFQLFHLSCLLPRQNPNVQKRFQSGHGLMSLHDAERKWTAIKPLVGSSALRCFSSNAPSSATPLGRKELLKKAVRDYGSTVIVFHVAISLASLGGFYAAVSSGLDVVGLVSHVPYLGEKIGASAVGSGATTFVIAYAVHKVFAPVRISITLTATPFIVKHLRTRGILKK